MRCPSSQIARVLQAGLASGALLGLATAQVGLGVLGFAALVPLLLLIDRGAGPLEAGAGGWVAGLLLYGCALAWIPLAEFPPRLVLVAALYVPLLALAPAAFAALLAGLRGWDRGLFLLASPLAWIATEYLRAQGALGYPAHQLGYALAAYPALIQLAAVGGVYALSLWIVAANAALLAAPGASNPARIVVGLLLLVPVVPGLMPDPPGSGRTLTVALVQPEARQPGRSATAQYRANLARLLELSERTLHAQPDLVIWPESAFERTVAPSGDPLLAALANHLGAPLLTGAWRRDDAMPAQLYNSAFLASESGVAHAGDKVRPVAFYERAAENRFETALERLGFWRGRFRSGERPGLVPLGPPEAAALQLGLLICADSSYPRLARSLRLRGADLLVELSNESLTGGWSAIQHSLVSRMRAVETGAPLVRVANTGPSEWIDARGRVVARLAPGRAAAGSARIELAGAPTPYARTGDPPVFLAAGCLPLAAALRRRTTRRSSARAKPQGDRTMPELSAHAPLRLTLPLLCALALCFAGDADAMDGANFSSATYYESVVGEASAEALASSTAGLPARLVLSDSIATARYVSTPGESRTEWTLQIRGLERSHEQVDALYHVIAVLPLPVDNGKPAFKTQGRGISAREGSEASSVPLIYGGEKIVLKRSVSLEKSLLPGLIGSGSDLLPSLAGSGYEYTMWDTIIRYDPNHGPTIQALVDMPYSTDVDVAPPDPSDERLKAYLVTWIPDLDASVPPFAIRIDVVPAD